MKSRHYEKSKTYILFSTKIILKNSVFSAVLLNTKGERVQEYIV